MPQKENDHFSVRYTLHGYTLGLAEFHNLLILMLYLSKKIGSVLSLPDVSMSWSEKSANYITTENISAFGSPSVDSGHFPIVFVQVVMFGLHTAQPIHILNYFSSSYLSDKFSYPYILCISSK